MKRTDIIKQIDDLEKDTDLFIKELRNNTKLTKSRFDLIDDITFILANLQIVSEDMQINKRSFEYQRLMAISNKIVRAR